MEHGPGAVPAPRTSGSAAWSAPTTPAQLRAAALTSAHGAELYKMARLLVGTDLARSTVTEVLAAASLPGASLRLTSEAVARRELGRQVFLACRAESLAGERTGRPSDSPPRRTRWLDTASLYQRAPLALCVYGGHTTAEAGALLALTQERVCELLRAALEGLTVAAQGAAMVPADRGHAPLAELPARTGWRE